MTISQSPSSPLVVVGGATGNQGGSVIAALAESTADYRIRGLTRDASRPGRPAELKKQGVTMVSVELKEVEAIAKAYEGADVVFAMTNFWEHVDGERELAEGKAMIDAGIRVGVKLFIFSALPPVGKLSGGKYTNVHHFEYKSKIADYGRLQAQAQPTFKFQTVEAGFYATNLLPSLGALVTKDQGGKWSFTSTEPIAELGAIPLPVVDINTDYGLWVRAVIEHKEVQDDPRPVLTCGEETPLNDLLKELEKKTGITIARTLVSQEELAKSLNAAGTPQHIIDDFLDMWPYVNEFGYYGGQDIHWADQYLARKPKTWVDWLETADLSDFA